jgi:glycosyltransferase involved in cell wall biosynthesis
MTPRELQAETPAEPGPERNYRVLMIAPTSFFADYGCHVRILEEAQILQKLGQQVTVVTYHNGGPVPGLDIRRGLPVPWRRNYEVGSSRHKVGLDALLGLKTLQLLARERFDIIHAHIHEGALLGVVLGRLFRVPLVFDFQGSMTEEMIDHHFLRRESPLYGPLRRIETWIDHSAPVVFTSSTNAECLLIDKFGCDPSRIRAVPDCVNTDVFRPATDYDPGMLDALRSSLGIPPDRKLIVYLGLLAQYQGTDLLLQALRCMVQERRDVHLLLMGFPSVGYYQDQAAALGVSDFVTFTGRVPYEHAPMRLALGDVAVAPKLSLTEGSGKLLNYMAVGLPVVAFDTPVAREYLGSDGILATRGDVDSLAEKLLDCLFPPASDPQKYSHLGLRLRQRATVNYGWAKEGRRILRIYRQLLGDEPQPASRMLHYDAGPGSLRDS